MSMPSPALFFETINAYQRTAALKAALELNLFTALAEGPRSAGEIASACGVAERGARILADYLTILGFLTKSGTTYALTPDSAMFLNSTSPAYLGGALEFLLTPDLLQSYEHLTTAVRQGGTALAQGGTVSHDNPVWVAFARAMKPMMALPARLMVDQLPPLSTEHPRVLDVAAGHGIFGITLAQRYPHAHVTALDWNNVLQVAQENAAAAGLGSRYQLLPGSAFEVAWGGPYDLVLLTNFLHHFDVPTCDRIAQLAFNSLAPGGLAVTIEFVPEEDRITPPSTASFALTMLATTTSGDAYTFSEYDAMFRRAGFAENKLFSLAPTTQQAIVSRKS